MRMHKHSQMRASRTSTQGLILGLWLLSMRTHAKAQALQRALAVKREEERRCTEEVQSAETLLQVGQQQSSIRPCDADEPSSSLILLRNECVAHNFADECAGQMLLDAESASSATLRAEGGRVTRELQRVGNEKQQAAEDCEVVLHKDELLQAAQVTAAVFSASP